VGSVNLSLLKTVARLVAGALAAAFYGEKLGLVDVTGSIEEMGGRETATPGGVQ